MAADNKLDSAQDLRFSGLRNALSVPALITLVCICRTNSHGGLILCGMCASLAIGIGENGLGIRRVISAALLGGTH